MKIEMEIDGIRIVCTMEAEDSRIVTFEECARTLANLVHHYIDAKFSQHITLGPPAGVTILPTKENDIPDDVLCTGERLKINKEEVTK